MNIVQFIKLLQRNILFLLIIPVILAGLVFVLTNNMANKYSSDTTIYTGIASGYSIESQNNSATDYFAVNNAFDNLINIINSRSTMEEVSLTLFARCMMTEKADPYYISEESFRELQSIVPDDVKALIDKTSLENSVKNLNIRMNKDASNFVYELVNLSHPFFSVDAISEIRAFRIASSDMVKISYESTDPGICRATLEILSSVIIKNYSGIKANQTDAVLSYFDDQLEKSNNRLKAAEDSLLKFNQKNKIINYDEQTKSISEQKTELELRYQTEMMTFKGAESIIKRLDEKLTNTQKIILKNEEITAKRNDLARISSAITFLEIYADTTGPKAKELQSLRTQAKKVTEELNASVQSVFLYKNEKGGLTSDQILADWLQNTVTYEESKARIMVLEKRIKDFAKEYDTFAPLGATLKRIEREINVAEQEYLSSLHGLSLAKLKQQDLQLSSNIKPIDPPYFPITPEPSKRKILVFAAGIFGFILVAFVILLLEYFDSSIKTPGRIEKLTGLKVAIAYPAHRLTKGTIDLSFVETRAIDWLAQKVKQKAAEKANLETPQQILFFSTQAEEGKSTIGSALSEKLSSYGKRVLYVNYSSAIHKTVTDYNLKNIQASDKFTETTDYLKDSGLSINDISNFDYVLVEIPDLLSTSFPTNLLNRFDQAYLTCRANREWTPADQNSVNLLQKSLTQTTPEVALNGVDLSVMETFVGEIPKQRSAIHILLKKIIRFQFHSKAKIT